ncbi:hypothetical protein M569_13474 [Genlisea aurea]|uniref:Uncharacterized protein n=1 Tax=Genlisea aurea TaxID=192259 RepID=S8CAE1_9LAMI|nr:hypothetical protein M569_13474 [Genlisea aurea]
MMRKRRGPVSGILVFSLGFLLFLSVIPIWGGAGTDVSRWSPARRARFIIIHPGSQGNCSEFLEEEKSCLN